MNKIYKDLARVAWKGVVKRNISRNVALHGDDKTTVHILNREQDFGLMIDGYSEVGFRLNNGVTVIGPMVIFRRSVLSWDVGSIDDINEASLSLFSILEPKLDILVLGVGDPPQNHNFFHKLLPFSNKLKISFEILPTEHACTTFNFLNVEGRNAAAALIPPTYFRTTMNDELESKLRYQNLYEDK